MQPFFVVIVIVLVTTTVHVFPRIIARGDYFFYLFQKGAIIQGRRLFKEILQCFKGNSFEKLPQKGAIIQGGQLFEGRLLFEEI